MRLRPEPLLILCMFLEPKRTANALSKLRWGKRSVRLAVIGGMGALWRIEAANAMQEMKLSAKKIVCAVEIIFEKAVEL